MVRKRELCAGVAAVLTMSLFVPTGTVFAQGTSNGNNQIEEITVTSQRCEEKLQTVPLSVTAFSPANLETRQINDTLDLAEFVPNMVAHNNTGLGSANTYYIRGLGN